MDFNLVKNIGLLTGIVVFSLYVAYIWGRYGIQKSISISFYDLPPENRIVFRVFIWTLSLSIMLSGIGWKSPMFFASGLLLSLVGVFSDIKVKWKFTVHLTGAIGGILSCWIGLGLINQDIGIIIGILILLQSSILFLVKDREHFIWNVEITCFTYLISGLLYQINLT
jgi:hypothetical protein